MSAAEAAGPERPFVHLRVRSAFSLLEGALPVKRLGELARAHGMPALAVTDTNNLFGALEVSESLAKTGVQPIHGVSLGLSFEGSPFEMEGRDARNFERGAFGGRRFPEIALLAQSEVGYANLMRLSSRAYLDSTGRETPHVPLTGLEGHADGLILLTGGAEGPVNRLLLAGREREAEALLEYLAGLFPERLYVELQRHGAEPEQRTEAPMLDFAYGAGLPIVATNDCQFRERSDYAAHDALLCIAEGAYVSQSERRRLTEEHYFKSPAEMAALFEDLPEALAATEEIARRSAFRVSPRGPLLPAFTSDAGLDEAEELRRQAKEGLKKRLASHPLFEDEQAYWDRLDYELGVIIGMEFPGYFLIVSDFMKWSRARGIPVGVRGSGATSIVAWALEITSLDPLRFGLVFERFLNPERISMPDFDIDFCQDRRSEVIRYVQDRYGTENVAQIITFGTLQARAVVRDVGRVLQLPYGQVDRICKMIPAAPGVQVTLQEAIDGEPRLQAMIAEEPEVSELMELAGRLEGLYRHASTHAAGLVIGDRPLVELIALFRDPKADLPVTQFHYKDAEKAGLVKFDFLGLKTLTVIAATEGLLAERGVEVESETVEFDDTKSFEMLAKGDSVGVFQLESAGMRDLLRKMRPDRIEDLIALVALYRPGPMDSIPKYIACKHGRERPDYLHPMLEQILRETFGVMTYQEDVMRIARELAGYSLGDADLLRRAMGKKIKAEMDKHEARFIEGSAQHDISPKIAKQIFEQAAKFAGYGFNKGHAAAYAQVAYRTAYLKANYPLEFLCASMTLDMERHDRLAIFRQEAGRLGIPVLGPDVNRSGTEFRPEKDSEDPAIRYALTAVKNVGQQAVEAIVAERETSGPFVDLFDFAARMDPQLVNKRALEGLARAGAFDSLDDNRHRVVMAAELLLSHAASAAEERRSGQTSLFEGGGVKAPPPVLPDVEDWLPLERLEEERAVLGFYLSGHPLDDYARSLKRARVLSYGELVALGARAGSPVKLAGVVHALQEKKSQRTDGSFGILTLSDPSGQYEVRLFSELLVTSREMLQPGACVVLTAQADWGDEEVRLRAEGFRGIEAATASAAAGLKIFVDDAGALPGIGRCLDRRGRGQVTLTLQLESQAREVELDLGTAFDVSAATRQALKAVPGVFHVEEL